MPRPCFIGVDLGTSGVRALAIDDAATPIAQARSPLPSPQRQHGAIVQDPQLWWRAVSDTLLQLIPRLAPYQPAALAIDGTSGTLLASDRSGKPLGPALMYNDARPAQLVGQIAAHAPRNSAAHGATSAAAKALWLIARHPELAQLLHQADWILGRLLGEFRYSDENNVLKLGFDPVTRHWPEWLSNAGIDPELLPQPLPPGTPVGTISLQCANRLGLPDTMVLVAGTTDSTASFLATGAREPGEGVTSLGSTLVVKILSTHPVFSPEHGVYSHRLHDLWLAGGGSNSGGNVLRQYFDDAEIARITPFLDPEQPTGLDYYPLASAGERFPRNDPLLEPHISPIPTDRTLFLQGLLEGISEIERMAYHRLHELGAPPLRTVRTTGGGTANPAWQRLRQHRLRVPMIDAVHTEAAYGTALLARQGSNPG